MDVEWLILADAAQVTGGKLYLLGGGWNQLTANKFPHPQSMSIALSIAVPWTRTNEKHSFEIEIASADGETIKKLPGQFEVGRPAGLPPGQDQRAQFAVNINWTIDRPGGYVVIARLDGEEGRRFPFSVLAGPMASIQRRGGQGGE